MHIGIDPNSVESKQDRSVLPPGLRPEQAHAHEDDQAQREAAVDEHPARPGPAAFCLAQSSGTGWAHT